MSLPLEIERQPPEQTGSALDDSHAVLGWLEMPEGKEPFPKIIPDQAALRLCGLYGITGEEPLPSELLRRARDHINALPNPRVQLAVRHHLSGFDERLMPPDAANLSHSLGQFRRVIHLTGIIPSPINEDALAAEAGEDSQETNLRLVVDTESEIVPRAAIAERPAIKVRRRPGHRELRRIFDGVLDDSDIETLQNFNETQRRQFLYVAGQIYSQNCRLPGRIDRQMERINYFIRGLSVKDVAHRTEYTVDAIRQSLRKLPVIFSREPDSLRGAVKDISEGTGEINPGITDFQPEAEELDIVGLGLPEKRSPLFPEAIVEQGDIVTALTEVFRSDMPGAGNFNVLVQHFYGEKVKPEKVTEAAEAIRLIITEAVQVMRMRPANKLYESSLIPSDVQILKALIGSPDGKVAPKTLNQLLEYRQLTNKRATLSGVRKEILDILHKVSTTR